MGFFGGGGSPYYTSGKGVPAANKPLGTIYTDQNTPNLYISNPNLTAPVVAGGGTQFAHAAGHGVPGSIALPAAPTVGNLVLVFLYANGDTSANLDLTKWTILDNGNNGINFSGFAVYRYVKAGDLAALPALCTGVIAPFWGATAVEIANVPASIGAAVPYKYSIYNQNAASLVSPSHNADSASELALLVSLQYNGTANVAAPAGMGTITSWNDGAANFGAMGLFTLSPANGADITETVARVAGSNSQALIQILLAPTSSAHWGAVGGAATNDPFFADVAALVEVSAGGVISDASNSAKAITSNGAVATSAVTTKFGPRSIDLTAAGAYLNFAASTDFDANGNGNGFTWETWLYFTALAASDNIIFDNRAVPNTPGVVVFIAANGNLCVFDGVTKGSTGNVSANKWHHVAFEAENGMGYLWLDGQLLSSFAFADSGSPGGTFKIGMRNDATLGLRGYFEQVRITKGACRYRMTTEPTATFPTS